MYDIWRRFPAHVRRGVAASARSAPGDPLGTALRLLGHSSWPKPRAVEVADALVDDESDRAWHVVLQEAQAFIADWDAGRVADLFEAVGCPDP